MAFVSIMAIVAIILVGGGIIAFIGHMVIGAFDNRKDIAPQRKDVLDYADFKRLEQGREEVAQDIKEFDFKEVLEAKNEKVDEDIFKLDAEVESNEDLESIENRLKEENKKESAEPVVEIKEETKPVEATDEDEFGLDALLDEISNDVIAEEQEEIKEENAPQMSDALSAYSIDKILAGSDDETEDSVEEVEETVEDVVETEDVEEETVEPVTEEVKEVEEKTETNNEVEELKAQLAELNKQLEIARSANVEVVTINMTEEECVSRLEVLEERLKNVKKDYKINMKEYRPLKKVMNDLERYQAKLRRKETSVAKKKVALYGVNNYVDIDKEKAEKLANEIELYEGLRLSVAHCEEVINANKDRFPILEHTNQILEDQISHIEADIESTKATLQKIRDQKDGEDENK